MAEVEIEVWRRASEDPVVAGLASEIAGWCLLAEVLVALVVRRWMNP